MKYIYAILLFGLFFAANTQMVFAKGADSEITKEKKPLIVQAKIKKKMKKKKKKKKKKGKQCYCPISGSPANTGSSSGTNGLAPTNPGPESNDDPCQKAKELLFSLNLSATQRVSYIAYLSLYVDEITNLGPETAAAHAEKFTAIWDPMQSTNDVLVAHTKLAEVQSLAALAAKGFTNNLALILSPEQYSQNAAGAAWLIACTNQDSKKVWEFIGGLVE